MRSSLESPASTVSEARVLLASQRPSDAPLTMAFVITSMPVGGAEVLLLNLVKRLPNHGVQPLICCLKDRGELGEQAAQVAPLFDGLIRHKYDLAVLGRLRKLFRRHRVDAVVTVGAGDKMFWGRLAARWAGVRVVLSALHSTGWPDGVSRLNRLLTPLTDGFIGVAASHGRFLVEQQRFPQEKVFVIPNGIDTDRFEFCKDAGVAWRRQESIPADAKLIGIVAALRPEKNHGMFLSVARRVLQAGVKAHFAIVGDGPCRNSIQRLCQEMGISQHVSLTGTCRDIPAALSAMDLFALTSHNEASPVSIMEALACRRPVVATRVGSVDELVIPGMTGDLVAPGDDHSMACRIVQLLEQPSLCQKMGDAGRIEVAKSHSLEAMAAGYARLAATLMRGPLRASNFIRKTPPWLRWIWPRTQADANRR